MTVKTEKNQHLTTIKSNFESESRYSDRYLPNNFIKYFSTDKHLDPSLAGGYVIVFNLVCHFLESFLIDELSLMFLIFCHILILEGPTKHLRAFKHVSHGLGKDIIQIILVVLVLPVAGKVDIVDCVMREALVNGLFKDVEQELHVGVLTRCLIPYLGVRIVILVQEQSKRLIVQDKSFLLPAQYGRPITVFPEQHFLKQLIIITVLLKL